MEKLRGMFPQKVRKEKMPLEQCAFRCCIALIGVKLEHVILPLNQGSTEDAFLALAEADAVCIEKIRPSANHQNRSQRCKCGTHLGAVLHSLV